jgi:hypothetical protein
MIADYLKTKILLAANEVVTKPGYIRVLLTGDSSQKSSYLYTYLTN